MLLLTLEPATHSSSSSSRRGATWASRHTLPTAEPQPASTAIQRRAA